MSKKQLLEESTIRKFMKLANLEPLSDRFIKEDLGYTNEEEVDMDPTGGAEDMAPMDMDAPVDDGMGDDEGGLEVDLDDAGGEGEVSPEVAKKVLKAVMGALGVQGTVEDDEDMGDDENAGEMDDFAGDEEAGEDEEETGEEDFGGEEDEEESDEEELDESEEVEEAKKEMDESRLSEDELVENVLRRVTTRLIAEAKKANKKDVKARMNEKKKDKKAKKKEELEEEKHIVTHKKANPLLTKGGNNYKAFKGKANHVMGKGENGGKGDEEMKPLKATQKHTVTHDKTSKVTSKSNKKS